MCTYILIHVDIVTTSPALGEVGKVTNCGVEVLGSNALLDSYF